MNIYNVASTAGLSEENMTPALKEIVTKKG